MLIALQKQKENIAEYVIYMFQVEMIIRSLDFKIDDIFDHYICQMTSIPEARQDVKKWYEEIIAEMREKKLEEKGHIGLVHESMDELTFLHNTLLTSLEDTEYQEVHTEAGPYIQELRDRSQSNSLSDIEVCLTGIFGKLTLRMAKKEISDETEMAFESFTKLLAMLSLRFKDFKTGNLKFQVNN
ncbi:MAG: DUF4924 family protein [Flavobacteriales bacterium]|jgi:hypothetical protein|nr:DUF4924 family protein [Flavobacteriales bacterium]MDB9932583.1 DUF4924 family protein [Flavobacteriales bacterium]MDG1175210.1 DUF4924 family protein [Flavobacteriales bacterium]|tara:strand:+ start:1886 stop:2440 length:555 start_codon:yes stop_codon:yes gene_type:complete